MFNCAIVIINWNSWDYLFPCLDKVGQQTDQDFRIIVVDNNSTYQPPASLLEKYPRLTLIRNEENLGFAAANNQAIQLAEDCEWIVLLNPDTLPDTDWLGNLCKAASEHPDFSFFGSRLVMAGNPDKLDGTGDVYHMSGLSWRSGHGLPVLSVSEDVQEIFSPCAAAAMYKREELLSVGGFDEDFFCYNEDVDLGFRLRLAGHRALSVPGSVVLHHGSATTSVRSDFAVYHGHRNLVWTWFKDMPMVLLWLFLPLHVLYTLACIFLYVKRGQGKVIIRAKWDAVKGLPHMLRKRKLIHSDSRISLSSLWKIINKCMIVGPGNKHKSAS
ncbi:MAG: glycosyltransferase family 2 protein [Thermodesulfobacteriota bacterium]|nr:glycosyltransferase family 2 protein [Thermodesulfobacteriota bacterium]